MKHLIYSASILLLALVTCLDGDAQTIATDYSNPANWMVQTANPTHEVDVFYLYPTSVPGDCKTLVGQIEEGMKHRAMGNYLKGAEAFSSFTNMYAPYYRQISGAGILVGSSRVDLQACKLEYSIVSPK